MRYAPDYIQFYPTIRCNLSCNFCFNKTMPFCDDITIRDFKEIVKRLHNLNIDTIDIIGGEPTLHKDIISMVEYAAGMNFCLNLSSNGTNTEILGEITTRFKNVNLGVSINESDMLERLKGFIRRFRPTVKTIFTNDIDINLLKQIHLQKPDRFYILYPDVMKTGDTVNTVHFSQFLFAAQRMKSLLTGTVYCSGFIPDVLLYPELLKVRCPAGTTKLGLMPDGSIYPCNLFFGIEDFRLGTLLNNNFEKIWNHRRLDFFRKFNRNLCPQIDCILHSSCHGGCPAHSFIHYGSIGSPEPRCIL